MEKKNILDQLSINLEHIKDEKIKETILFLFNLIEEQAATIRKLQEEVQRLRDENNRLKGERGKPDIKQNKNKDEKNDISSEKERKNRGDKNPKLKRKPKKENIKIDRTKICSVDKDTLPQDAEFKGYESVVIQDLKIETDNIEFKKEVYYSRLQKKTYMAPLPPGYEGEFGPTVKSLTIIMKNVCNMSEPKILEFLRNCKIKISAGTISNILIKNKEQFHQEKDELIKEGLKSTIYQQIDETSARVNGKNYHTHILCNPFYTAYFTTENKDRLTVLKILQNTSELKYCITGETFDLMKHFKVGKKHINKLRKFESDKEFKENEIEAFLSKHMPRLKERVKMRILEAMAISSYRNEADYPVVKVLLCDDAPQFKLLTEELALCWIHDGRNYKKLSPVTPYMVRKLDKFITLYWDYYQTLLDYKSNPSPKFENLLLDEFDKLFSARTGYDALDERILKTKKKKEHMLLVLKYPELPLHNNESELGARVSVRKRDVSLHTITYEGTQSNDTFLTIVQTCKKLGVNAFEYIFDRICKTFKFPSLAQIIKTKRLATKFEISVMPP